MEVNAMPYVIRPPVRRMIPTAALFVAAAFALLFPALSSAVTPTGCADVAVSNPFSIFGDNADYFLAKKGDFETDTKGWNFSPGTKIVNDNESYDVGGNSDTKSLSIQPSGRVVSTHFCIDERYPHVRFFAKQSDGSDGLLSVSARWSDALNVQQEVPLGTLAGSGFSSWAPSSLMVMAGVVQLTDQGNTQSVQLVFTPLSGTWQIDDVYVDPYRR
jgi:hypothetical protein